MKNSQPLFSLRMYREALSQLSLPGFILGGILLSVTLLMCWGMIGFGSLRFVSISDVWYPILLYIWTAPFLFTVLAFGFLTSRKNSDFYHALPLSRTALFSSYAAAIFTWLFFTTFITMALGSGILALAGVPTTVSTWIGVIYSALDFGTALLFAASLTMLAVSLSGTLFTSIVLTNVFLWLPLLVSALFRSGVLSAVPLVPPNSVSFFGLDLRITLFDIFGLFETSYLAHSFVNALWTLFVSIVLLGLATFFFVRRKSEMAGSSAASNRMQAAFRIVVASPPLLIAFSSLSLSTLLSLWGIFSLITALVISLILMCTFELISTKKWRNLLKVPLSFAITLALALLFSASIWAVSAYEASFSPDADDIRWVRIAEPARSSNSMTFYFDVLDGTFERWDGQNELRTLRSNRVQIDDPAVREAVAQQLREGRESFWSTDLPSSAPTNPDFLDLLYGIDSFMFDNEERITIEVRTTTGSTRQRYLSIGSGDWISSGFRVNLNDLGTALKEVGQGQ